MYYISVGYLYPTESCRSDLSSKNLVYLGQYLWVTKLSHILFYINSFI